MEYNLKKSCLRNHHVKALRLVEKKLKKAKGAQREQLEEELNQLLKRQEKELEELRELYKIQPKCVDHETLKPEEALGCQNIGSITEPVLIDLQERDWASLSTKELRHEAIKRQLGKKGNREALITKLVLFHNDLRRKTEHTDHHAHPKLYNDTLALNVDAKDSSQDSHPSQNSCYGDKFSSKHQKNRGLRKAFKSDNDDDNDNKSNEDPSDTSSFETNISHYENDDDIPDVQRLRGTAKEDTRGSYKRRCGGTKPNSIPREARHKGEPRPVITSQLDEEQRQQKREKVMQQILLKLTAKFPHGLSLQDIPDELQALNVVNFRPSLCGYTSLYEWIVHQPPNIVRFNEKTNKIYPVHSS